MILEIAIFVAAGMAFFLLKSRIQYLSLPNLPKNTAHPAANVTVVIPARNEERNIARVVGSFPGTPVIVVDDGSQDRTAEIAAEAGATVIQAPPIPKGGMGKPNACLAGFHAVTTEWVLFVDADTWYKPEFLPSLMAFAHKGDNPMLSCFLRQERVTLIEKIMLPYAFALYFCGVSGKRVNSLKYRDALANGQCFLVRRGAYEFTGGHGAVLNSIVEDVKLASIAKRHRVPVRVIRAEKLGSVRMYEGFKGIWNGFEKNSFRFLMINPRTGAQVVIASILVTSYVPVIAMLLWDDQPVAAGIFSLVPIICLAPWYGSATALLAPLAIYIFQLIAVSAMFSAAHGKKSVWKGRRV